MTNTRMPKSLKGLARFSPLLFGLFCRGASRTRKGTPLGPYRRPMPRVVYAGSSRSFTAIRKDAGPCCGSRLREGRSVCLCWAPSKPKGPKRKWYGLGNSGETFLINPVISNQQGVPKEAGVFLWVRCPCIITDRTRMPQGHSHSWGLRICSIRGRNWCHFLQN